MIEFAYTGKWLFGHLGPMPNVVKHMPFFLAGKRVYHIEAQRDWTGCIYRWRFAIGPFQIRRYAK